MEEEERLNPDELLKAIQQEESQKKLGKLKIFFGMAAGVGKTYAMLEEARERMAEGLNVIIGTVNTHGRRETEALLEGMTLVPEKWIKYKDTVFEELDVDKIIELKPDLVLVDELAHSNVPGSKHAKRWQDVLEIQDAGIDVYTTLNVQHIESRKDLVEGITGIQIRETVPDLVLERATNIEIVDLPPQDLLQRLREGKVYLGDQSLIAAQNFFKEDNLTALREIALRLAAEKVDHDLHGILAGKKWKTRERLMVAVSPSPSSEQLVRAARKLAFELDAPWVAVYVDTGKPLGDSDQARLNKHLNLAQELGAEVVTTHDLDIALALQRIAKQKDITRIVVGRPTQKRTFRDWFRSSLFDRLEQTNKHIDIIILRQDRLFSLYQKALPTFSFTPSRFSAYGLVIASIGFLTLLGFLVNPFIGYKSVGFIFLLGILVLSLFVGQGPIFLAAVLSALSWAFLFISPSFQSLFADLSDVILVIIYFCTAAIMGLLTSRIWEQDQFLKIREEKVEHLYEVVREIAKATNFQSLRVNVSLRLKSIFKGEFDILIKGADNKLVQDSSLSIMKQEKERAVAVWTYQNGKIAGWSTDTLPSSEAIYFPIKFGKETIGVLIYYPLSDRALSMDDINFLQSVTEQLGIYLERYVFESRMSSQDYVRQVEKIHSAIFRSLSEGVFAPLEIISENIDQIKKEYVTPKVHDDVEEIENASICLRMVLENILDLAKIESGFVHFDMKKQNIKELINYCVQKMEPLSEGHMIEVEMSDQDLFIDFDFHLMEISLNNLILNAIEYTPDNTPIIIKLTSNDQECKISVIDKGAGIPKDILPFIFEKFYRLPDAETRGIGLGLSIVKAVVDIHQGRIEVTSQEGGGTNFSIYLPL